MSALFSLADTLRTGAARTAGRASGGAFNPAADFVAKLETTLARGAAETASDASGAGARELPAIAGSDYGMYANVVLNGKVVASLSNSGCCIVADPYGKQIGDSLSLDGDGPDLAKERAEQIAKILGGTIQVLSTAQTQQQWKAGGKSVGKIDLWGLDGSEPPGYRPQLYPDSLDVLLRDQEATATA